MNQELLDFSAQLRARATRLNAARDYANEVDAGEIQGYPDGTFYELGCRVRAEEAAVAARNAIEASKTEWERWFEFISATCDRLIGE